VSAMEKISKTQIDRLGDRFKKNTISDADLKMLDEYRRSFGPAYEDVVGRIRQEIHLEPTGRPAKSTSSIIEKLHRESIRLSQVQDIAGCRVVVADTENQDHVITLFRDVFPSASVVDRRIRPSYGYRAVHVIIESFGKLIEVQVRTELQHGWAELSEKFSDKFDPAIKYGGGDTEIQKLLGIISDTVQEYEEVEKEMSFIQKNNPKALKDVRGRLLIHKKKITDIINKHINLTKEKRKP